MQTVQESWHYLVNLEGHTLANPYTIRLYMTENLIVMGPASFVLFRFYKTFDPNVN